MLNLSGDNTTTGFWLLVIPGLQNVSSFTLFSAALLIKEK